MDIYPCKLIHLNPGFKIKYGPVLRPVILTRRSMSVNFDLELENPIVIETDLNHVHSINLLGKFDMFVGTFFEILRRYNSICTYNTQEMNLCIPLVWLFLPRRRQISKINFSKSLTVLFLVFNFDNFFKIKKFSKFLKSCENISSLIIFKPDFNYILCGGTASLTTT